jgi:hypothetical protein
MRTVTSQRDHTTCETVAELLPWYVNGTLGAADRNVVDAHCNDCERCSASLKLERRVAESIRAPRDNIGQSPHAAWQRFEARLDQESPPHPPVASRRRWRAIAFGAVVAAQAAAIVTLAVVLLIERSTQELPRFRTLTQADNTLSIGRPLVRVAFDSGVSENQAVALASEAGGSVVAGPSPNNVYTFAFGSSENRESVDKKVTDLRRHPHVLLAEPVVLENGP